MQRTSDGRRQVAATAAFLILGAALYFSVVADAQAPQPGAPQAAAPQAASRCRVDGRVSGTQGPIPGASVVVHAGDALKAATSTDIDGKFAILFAPNSTYHLTVDLTAFATVERDITLGAPPCDTAVEVTLALRPRNAPATSSAQAAANAQPSAAAAAAGTPDGGAGATTADAGTAAADGAAANGATGGRGGRGGRGGAGGRGRQAGANAGATPGAGTAAGATTAQGRSAQRFQALNVEADASGAASLDDAPADDPADVERLLPAGFSLDAAQSSAVAITDNGDAASLDRGALGDRLQAIAGGQFDPATGQFAAGFGPGPDAFGGAQAGGAGQPGGRGGPGGGRGAPPGGRGAGPGGRGGFLLAGRGARGQSPYQGSVTYTFGGSLLNAAPFQLNPSVPTTQPQFAQNTAGFTLGGPLKIPGLYADTNRRTNFQVNYQGNRSNNVFDQYATVPTNAMRAGDFSGNGVQLVNPKTGQAFANNQIPLSAMDPAALALLPYIPAPNLPGDQLNYHLSTLTHTSTDALSLRFTQNLSRTVPQGGRGGRGGGPGGFGGGRGGFGGGGRGPGRGNARGTNVVLNAQLQVRHSDTQATNIFPGLGGDTASTSITAPIGLNIVRGRTVNNITVNIAHTSATSTNAFSNVQNVAGLAGIQYPSTQDPLNWGVPNLTFNSGLTGLRAAGASLRTDDRITTSYVWSHPFNRHQVRAGVDYRFDTTTTESNSNPRGTFSYSGAYSGAGLQTAGTTGADFADFLLGAPAQASLQVGGTTHLHGKSFDGYVEDNWQKNAKLTINLGLRYELALPYVEINGQMANLDVAPGFGAVAPVLAGDTGPYSGAFPPALLNADRNNFGPRIGIAYRMTAKTILRGGYSITYNPSSYASIARQLVAQPPFATAETLSGTTAPLDFTTALLTTPTSTSAVTNTYGVDKDYALGQIQTWNATITRNLTPTWSVVAGYTGIKGTDLDLLSVPNRIGPNSLLIPASEVQPYTFESSGAHSILNQGNFQLIRRLAHGVSGSASYTLSKSMDDSPSLGGGSGVAQNPQDLGAEWALSNFDRRQQFTGNLYIELPWGQNRRWLHSGGVFGNVLGDWAASFVYTAQTGTPLSINVLNAGGLLTGARGALRADYDGDSTSVDDPSTSEFFNTAAFTIPSAGLFGNSLRNMVIGPGSHQLNGQLVRDIRLGGNRALTLNINATNLLNTELWATVGTTVGTSTFGQVLSVRPPRTVTVNARFRF